MSAKWPGEIRRRQITCARRLITGATQNGRERFVVVK